MSSKSVPQKCQVRATYKNVKKTCQVSVSQVRASPQERRESVSSQSVPQECEARVDHKSVLHNSVKQECPTRVPNECVMSGCPTTSHNYVSVYCLPPSTYVSAFGFRVSFFLSTHRNITKTFKSKHGRFRFHPEVRLKRISRTSHPVTRRERTSAVELETDGFHRQVAQKQERGEEQELQFREALESSA